jgi:hypothetical protein
MIDIDSFVNIFPRSLASKLRESVIPIEGEINRESIARELHGEITTFSYHPSTPRDYIIINKGNHVARITPTFIAKDYFLYYFCTKILEGEIAENRVNGTYGGWRLGNEIRLREDEDDIEIVESAPNNSFNPFLWVAHWQDFQKKAFEYNNEERFTWVVKLDIANFYDNVNIELIDKKLYAAAPSSKVEYVDLLIHFLNNWNKKFEGYAKKSVGLPQDEISDSSRLLANFYLQDYDVKIKSLCDQLNAQYLRYADDMLFYCESKESAEKLVFEASKLLSKIGLNLNSSKVEYFDNLERFNQYWAFEIFELLGNPTITANINNGLQMFLDWKDGNVSFKEFSVLRRILNIDFSIFTAELRYRILGYLFKKEFVALMTNWAMNKIYGKLDDGEKTRFLAVLTGLIDNCNFNSFHYNVAIFYRKNEIEFDEGRLQSQINELKI